MGLIIVFFAILFAFSVLPGLIDDLFNHHNHINKSRRKWK